MKVICESKELATLKQLFILNAIFTKRVQISGLNVKSSLSKDCDLAYTKLDFKKLSVDKFSNHPVISM